MLVLTYNTFIFIYLFVNSSISKAEIQNEIKERMMMEAIFQGVRGGKDDAEVVNVDHKAKETNLKYVIERVENLVEKYENVTTNIKNNANASCPSSMCKNSDAAFSAPVWPKKFEKLVLETTLYPLQGKHMTLGKLDYNFDEKKEIMLRINGRYDPFCGFNGVHALKDTPCAHVVMNNRRYLVYPMLEDCCFCCDAEHGCGVLKPDWLKNATFINRIPMKWYNKNITTNLWFKRGVPPYIYVEKLGENGEKLETSEPLAVYKIPHVLQLFVNDKIKEEKNEKEFFPYCSNLSEEEKKKDCNLEELHKLEKVAKDVIEGNLPQWCNLEKPCSKMSACHAVQNKDSEFRSSLMNFYKGKYDFKTYKDFNYFLSNNEKKINKLHEINDEVNHALEHWNNTQTDPTDIYLKNKNWNGVYNAQYEKNDDNDVNSKLQFQHIAAYYNFNQATNSVNQDEEDKTKYEQKENFKNDKKKRNKERETRNEEVLTSEL